MQHMAGKDLEQADDYCHIVTLIVYMASLYGIVDEARFKTFNIMNVYNLPAYRLSGILDAVLKAFEDTINRPSFEHFEVPKYLGTARERLNARGSLRSFFEKYHIDICLIDEAFSSNPHI